MCEPLVFEPSDLLTRRRPVRTQQQAVPDGADGRLDHPAGMRVLLLVHDRGGSHGLGAAWRPAPAASDGQLRAVSGHHRRHGVLCHPEAVGGRPVQVGETGARVTGASSSGQTRTCDISPTDQASLRGCSDCMQNIILSKRGCRYKNSALLPHISLSFSDL